MYLKFMGQNNLEGVLFFEILFYISHDHYTIHIAIIHTATTEKCTMKYILSLIQLYLLLSILSH